MIRVSKEFVSIKLRGGACEERGGTQERVSSDARSISAPSDGAQTKQLRPSTAAVSLVPPPRNYSGVTVALHLPRYYWQSIKTKAPGIRRRIKLYTWERDLREEILSTASVIPLWTGTDSPDRESAVLFVSGGKEVRPSGSSLATPSEASSLPRFITSAQYCCLVSESMCANPPSTSAFIRDLCTELDSRWRGGLRLANCFARFHQLSHCTTMFALDPELVSDKSRI